MSVGSTPSFASAPAPDGHHPLDSGDLPSPEQQLRPRDGALAFRSPAQEPRSERERSVHGDDFTIGGVPTAYSVMSMTLAMRCDDTEIVGIASMLGVCSRELIVVSTVSFLRWGDRIALATGIW